jgi:outer membrane receptor for Fe3+-dicitrate
VVQTDSYGASLQLTLLGKLAGMENQFVAGMAADLANSSFTQSEQEATFTDSRGTIGTGGFAPQTNAHTRDANYGLYFDDTLSLTKQWSLSLAGRYNWSKAVIGDESGVQPLLDGNHTFSRFNPAVGINWNPVPGFTAYATYNEGMRSPTAIELACADPTAPCSLPNDFIADPSLQPVISRTFEIGARGRLGQASSWSAAAAYSTTLSNDIQFVSSNGAASTLGFFQNVGKTRRQGFELAGRSRFGPIRREAEMPATRADRYVGEVRVGMRVEDLQHIAAGRRHEKALALRAEGHAVWAELGIDGLHHLQVAGVQHHELAGRFEGHHITLAVGRDLDAARPPTRGELTVLSRAPARA